MPPTLYLMFGYPGSGKTTAAKAISQTTGATHLWADHERRRLSKEPTYSPAESLALYKAMNSQTAALLADGHSVVFDTSFSYYRDRQNLRDIAAQHNAACLIIWVKIPLQIAKTRATLDAHLQDTRVLGNMSATDFERLSGCMEPPRPDEKYLIVDGDKITNEYISAALNLTAPS